MREYDQSSQRPPAPAAPAPARPPLIARLPAPVERAAFRPSVPRLARFESGEHTSDPGGGGGGGGGTTDPAQQNLGSPTHPGDKEFDEFAGSTLWHKPMDVLESAAALFDKAGQTSVTFGGKTLAVDDASLTALLQRVRWSAMDKIDEYWTKTYQPALGTAAADEAARKAAQNAALGAIDPFLTFLRRPIQNKQANLDRFEHFAPQVIANCTEALQLKSVQAAQGQMDHQFDDGTGVSAAKQNAYDTGLAAGNEWCGAFADLAHREAGLTKSKDFTIATQGTWGLEGLFKYAKTFQMSPKLTAAMWAWTGSEWVTVEELHNRRGARRVWLDFDAKPMAELLPQIRPGDVVLQDNAGDSHADHIQTVDDVNGSNLITIGGNENSQVEDSDPNNAIDTDAERAAGHALRDKTNAEISKGTSVGIGTRDMNKEGKAGSKTADRSKDAKLNKSRVTGIGRFSIVDYEEHFYTVSEKKPGKPPAGF